MAITTPAQAPAPAGRQAPAQPHRIGGGFLDPKMLWQSLPSALAKLDPRVQLRNPVMFVVEVGAALTTYSAITTGTAFAWTIAVWLWLTVIFANLAEAVAEGRGKAQAATLRRTKQETMARRPDRLEARRDRPLLARRRGAGDRADAR